MRKTIFLAITIAGLSASSHALADEIFTYTGNSFSTFFPGAGFPAIPGAVTATVDLMCDPCGAGAYNLATGASGTASDAMGSFTLSSGPGYGYSFASSSTPPAGFTTEQVIDDTVILGANGKITGWALELRTAPSGNYVATYNTSFITQDFADQNNINISISSTPGTWSCLTANGTACGLSPAPGPIPGAGLLSYVALGLLGLGSVGWKRLRRA